MLPVRAKHIDGDRWEVSLPARRSAVKGRAPVRPRRTVHAASEAEAARIGSELLAREYIAWKSGVTMDLAELTYWWLDHAAAGGIYTEDTAHDYELVVARYLEPNFAMDADAATALDIEELYAFLLAQGGKDGEGISARSVRKLHTVLRAAYGFLLREKVIDHNPMPEVEAPSAATARARSLTDREMAALFEALERELAIVPDSAAGIKRRNYMFGIYIDSWIGARVGEICALTRECISWRRGSFLIDGSVSERGRLHVNPPKTKSGRRTVYPGTACMDATRAHIEWQASYLTAEQRQSDATPLCTTATGGYLRPSDMSDAFKGLAEELGIELTHGQSLHILRHTQASQLLADGESLENAKERLGHARGTTTLEQYGHVLPGSERKTAERYERIVSEARREAAWR